MVSDIIAFRCAISAENDNTRIAKARMEEMLIGIFDDLRSDRYRIFLSGEGNFRYTLYPRYKHRRREKPSPRFLEDCREHLVKYWNAELSIGWEADDSIGIAASLQGSLEESPPIICSIDKDLKQIPGQHWNFVKKELEDVSRTEGIARFFCQVLTGDSTDDVPGLKGIGPVKAARILDGLFDEYSLFQRVRQEYADDDYLLLMGRLIWILREEGKLWEFPVNVQDRNEGCSGGSGSESSGIREKAATLSSLHGGVESGESGSILREERMEN